MRRTLGTATLLSAGLLAVFASGCNWNMLVDPHGSSGKTVITAPPPPVTQLVGYLNDNAAWVSAIQCNQVSIACREGIQSVNLTGKLACQKPRNFRLKADLLGQPGADLGSNDTEFWYWI